MNTMTAHARIIAFRDLLRAKFPEAHAPHQTAGEITGGIQLVGGAISEVVAAHPGAGAGLLLAAWIESCPDAVRAPVALIDGADSFDPLSVPREVLPRLLWLRCRDPQNAVRAADLLLRDGNIPRVLLDLQFCQVRAVRQISAQAWHRLRLLAEKSGVAFAAVTSFQTVPCARMRLLLEQPHSLEALDTPRTELLSRLNVRVTHRGALPQSIRLSVAS